MFYVFSKPDCTFCDQAKELLTRHALPYEEHSVTDAPHLKSLVTALWDVKGRPATVPLIIHNSIALGGYTELVKHLENSGEQKL